jgi:hypothetical protein
MKSNQPNSKSTKVNIDDKLKGNQTNVKTETVK